MYKRRKRKFHYHKKKKHKTIKPQGTHILGPEPEYVSIYKEELDILSKYILDYPDRETGGQLFGHWTIDGTPIICFVLGPGENAEHLNSFFMQDLDYLRSCSTILKNNYALEHIGEWHSHHRLGLEYPSEHDARNIATNMIKLGYKKFLLCIGTCTDASSIKAFMFSNGKKDYKNIPWFIEAKKNVIRTEIERNFKSQFVYPKTLQANLKNLYTKDNCLHSSSNPYSSYWLSDKNNRKILKQIIDFINSCEVQNCLPTIDENNEVHISIQNSKKELKDIHFPRKFPIASPIVSEVNGKINKHTVQWIFTGHILTSFISFYRRIKL